MSEKKEDPYLNLPRRYVVTHLREDGLRVLTFAAQGRKTHVTREEAQASLELFKEGLKRVLGERVSTLEVRSVLCWRTGDPVRTVFDDDGLESAEHWEKEADTAEQMAQWDREQGRDLSAPGQSPGDHKAKLYRATARRLRLEAETGEAHCACHESTVCPLGRV